MLNIQPAIFSERSIIFFCTMGKSQFVICRKVRSSARELWQPASKMPMHTIAGNCDYFITVDRRLLKYRDERITICSPIEFINNLEI